MCFPCPALRTLLASAAALWFAHTAAALEWKRSTVDVTTAPFQKTLTTTFEFKNVTGKPVTIQTIETSCHCLEAKADAKTYAPGSAGVINAEFTVGDRGGLYERTITVVTDEPDSPVRLTLRVQVPELASVTPRSTSWRVKDPVTEKSFDVKAADGLEIVFSEAVVTNESFTARLETVRDGRHYRLFVKPGDTSQPVSAAVRLKGQDKSGHEVIISAYTAVW